MLTASQNAASSLEPIEAGTHPAVCYALIDIGEQFNEKYNKASRKFVVMFEVIGQTFTDKEGKERNRSISSTYTMSLNEKSALYRDLISWRGKPFTPEELKGFNLRNIVGAPCLLSITHTERNGNTYANISGIMKMPKGMATQGLEEKIIFDLDDPDALGKMKALPEWIQKRIEDSVTYQDLTMDQAKAGLDELAATAGQMQEIGDEDGQLPF